MPVMPEMTELASRPSLFVANVTMTLIARALNGKLSELRALCLVFPTGISNSYDHVADGSTT